MHNIFIAGKGRKINHANFNRYEKGTLHPDRILDKHDLFYILEGHWKVGQDGTDYYLEKGDLIILHAGYRHYGVENCLPGTRTMFLHMTSFPEDRLTSAAEEKEMIGENLLKLPVVVRCGGNAAVLSLFQDIIFTFWSDLPNKNIKIAALLDLLLFELEELGKKSPETNDALINDVLSLIRLSGEKVYTLAELSEQLHISSRTLTDRFRKVLGKSVHQYQTDLKLEMAYMTIKYEKDRTLKEVAVNHGFYDEFHFSKLFKKKYGFPPSRISRP